MLTVNITLHRKNDVGEVDPRRAQNGMKAPFTGLATISGSSDPTPIIMCERGFSNPIIARAHCVHKSLIGAREFYINSIAAESAPISAESMVSPVPMITTSPSSGDRFFSIYSDNSFSGFLFMPGIQGPLL